MKKDIIKIILSTVLINLQELSDLFGTDVPTVLQDGRTSFEWKDGPLLTAINNGHWILLDEVLFYYSNN